MNEREIENAKKVTLKRFREMPKEKAKEDLRKWDDDALKGFMEIAIPTDDYEVCQYIHEVLTERLTKSASLKQ